MHPVRGPECVCHVLLVETDNGLVLIDSSAPRQLERMPGYREDYEAEKRLRPAQIHWERLRVWTGWERLLWTAPGNKQPVVYRPAKY